LFVNYIIYKQEEQSRKVSRTEEQGNRSVEQGRKGELW